MRGIVIVTTALILACTAASCDRSRDSVLEDLKRLELLDREPKDRETKTEEELIEAIEYLEKEVERTVEAGTHLETYYRLVAARFRERKLYGLAAGYFRKALELSPENPILAYWCAVCVAKQSEAMQTEETRRPLLDEARRYYEYAVRLEPRYTDALYGLSILLIFEYDELDQAETYLERILAIETRDFRAMFLLARVYVVYGRIDDAVALYDRIIAESENETMLANARENRNSLLGGTRAR
jgi:tetratricopeptide (TPR) repeat protein